MHESTPTSHEVIRNSKGSAPDPRDGRGETARRPRRFIRATATGLVAAMVAGTLSIIAATAIVTTASQVAGAGSIAATWSSSPSASGFVTATPPVGTYSATLTLTGGGGGSGGTNDNSVAGGAGSKITGTFNLTHSTGEVAVQISNGGGGGVNCGSDLSSCTAGGASGGAGYEAGGNSGQAESESASVQGAASGGAGGGASALFLGSNSSGTRIAIAGGGGGAGGQHGCDSDYSNGGVGGAGASSGSGATAAGSAGGESGDSEGGGSAGAAGGAAGAGSASGSNNGGHEGTSTAGGGGAGASGGSGNGGDDYCTTGENSSGGGGGGASAANSSYYSTAPAYSSAGNGGASQGAGGAGSVSLTWNYATVTMNTPSPANQTVAAGGSVSVTPSTATDSDSLGLTYTASGLPSWLTINSSTGAITGTAPTAPTTVTGITVTATDTQAATATTSAFSWTVTPAAPAKVVFTTEPPTSGTAGTGLTNFDAAVEDTYGNVETGSNTGNADVINLTVASGPGSIASGTSATASSGTAAFTSTVLDTAGSYTLTATDGTRALTTATSTPATTIAPTTPNKVVFSTAPPTSGTAGSSLTSFAASVEDTYGNVETGSSTGNADVINLSVASGPGSIASGTSATASGGVATFSSTVLDTAGSYTFTATDGSRTLSTATSTAATVVAPAAPNKLVFTTAPPTSGTAGSTLTSFAAAVEDTYGNVETGSNTGNADVINLSVATGPGSIASGTSATASGGVATFNSTVLDTAGSYTFTATDGTRTLSTATSTAATVIGPGTASKLVITQEPVGGVTEGVNLSTPPKVSVEDASGNVVTSDTGPVTIGINSYTAGLGGTTAGTLACAANTVNAVAGVASFSNCQITGSLAAGTYTLSGTRSGLSPTGASSNVTIAADTVTVANPGTQTATSGTAISTLTNSATESSAAASITNWSASGLPAGLSINSTTGHITGTPTTACGCSVTVTATDSYGYTGTATFIWNVSNTVTVANPGTQSSASGTAITNQTNSATDSSSTATIASWSQTGLPAGLSFNTTNGTVSGTPTTACSCSVTITATDSAGYTGSATFTWNVSNTVTVANPGTQSSTSGTSITDLTSSATDSSSTATIASWSQTGLPAGLSFNTTDGTVSGTPTTACSCSVTITATDSAGYTGSATFTWNVSNTVTVANPGTQSSTSGTSITDLTSSATDSSSTATIASWSQTGLPAGLSFDTTDGTVSGNPTTACSCSVTITATDSAGASGSATFTWNVSNTVSVGAQSAQSDVSGTAISTLSNSATDSSSTATISSWSATGLPSGLSIDTTTGDITGTPDTAGIYSVTVTATDSAGFSGSTSFSWTITNTVSVANPGDQSDVSGTAISTLPNSATDSSSTATLTWSAAGLPAGLSIDSSTGDITGTPTTACSCSVTVTATDGSSYSGSATFNWDITNTVSVANPGDQSDVSGTAISTLPNSATDSSSTATITSWSATGLPSGLSIDSSTGDITGAPDTACSCTVTVTATDDSGYTGSATFNWDITNTVSVANPGDQSDVSGTAVSTLSNSATDSSSTATLTWSEAGLPAGLSIDASTGDITGTPTAACSCSVTVTATDGSGYSGSATFTWDITNTVSVANPGDQSDVSGTAISTLPTSATDSSSTATLTYSATGLPTGLSIDPATGDIAGTPDTAGIYSVTVTATDDSEYAGSTSFSWTITNIVSVASPGDQSDLSGSAITAVDVSATDSSSTATLAYSATGLPAGLSIDPGTGIISGTPTTAGTSTVTVTASDASGATDSASFSWTISDNIAVSNPGPQTDTSGSAITTVTVTAMDTSSTATVTLAATGLPDGLSIDPTSGDITGTPTTACACTVTVTASDSSSASAMVTFSWTIDNTVTPAATADQTSVSGTAISPIDASGTDSSSTTTLGYSDNGTLPPGLSVDPISGSITGTPTTGGAYAVAITATDGAGYSATDSFNWTVTDTVGITGPGAQSGQSGTAVTPVSVSATDTSTTATITFSDNGTLPPGVSVDPSSGDVTGTPTTGGDFPVTITATDSAGYSGSTSFEWIITNVVTPAAIGDQAGVSGTAITPIDGSATDTSSTATFSYTDSGTLPAGVSIDPGSGSITGTPTTAGTYPVTITATDSAGFTATSSFNWVVTNVITLTTQTGVTDVTGTAMTPLTVPAVDSSSTATIVSWAASALPPGLSINTSTGAISGTPTTAGNYRTVTVTATDSAGFSGSTHFEWDITNLVTVAAIADQSTNTFYAATPVTPSATDSQVTPAVTISWSATGLPNGISIDHSTGEMSGTPTAPGTYPVTVKASDSAVPIQTGTTSFTWTVTTLAPVVSAVSPASGPGSGGTSVKITGTNLQDTTTVLFGSTPGTITAQTQAGTQVTVTTPVHASGTVNVTVTASGGNSATSSADQFNYLGPLITSITPSTGSSTGGGKIKIRGTGLAGPTSVLFGSTPATTVKANKAGTLITATIPSGTVGVVTVSVSTPGGTSASNSADQYTYIGPAVTSITPTGGLPAGGKPVHITGTGFQGATAVHFGSVTVTTFTVNKAGTTIKVTAPPGVEGTVNITVTAPGGTSAIVTGDEYTYS